MASISDPLGRVRAALIDSGGECSQARRKAGLPYPRTCSRCGLGPCAAVETARLANADDLAMQIADKVFFHITDRRRRDELAVLLSAFAAEVRRSTIEP